MFFQKNDQKQWKAESRALDQDSKSLNTVIASQAIQRLPKMWFANLTISKQMVCAASGAFGPNQNQTWISRKVRTPIRLDHEYN